MTILRKYSRENDGQFKIPSQAQITKIKLELSVLSKTEDLLSNFKTAAAKSVQRLDGSWQKTESRSLQLLRAVCALPMYS